MTRQIAALVTAGTLLMMGCGRAPQAPPPEYETFEVTETHSMFEVAETEAIDLRVSGTAAADVDLRAGTKWRLWAQISAADPHGVSVDGVEDGDTLTIETLSGVAYFSGKSGWWQVASAVYKVTAGVVPTGSIAANAITEIIEFLPGDGEDDVVTKASKPRDAYGRQLDDGRFAEEEGGIVICMPVAGGPMYSHDANHFTREGEARPQEGQPVRDDWRGMKPESEMPGKCFPVARGKTTYNVKGSGVLHVYAFDHNYRDNAGSYEIKFRIERASK